MTGSFRCARVRFGHILIVIGIIIIILGVIFAYVNRHAMQSPVVGAQATSYRHLSQCDHGTNDSVSIKCEAPSPAIVVTTVN
jgi:uncharacterized membrane protein